MNDSNITENVGEELKYCYKVTALPMRQLVLLKSGLRLAKMYIAKPRPTRKNKNRIQRIIFLLLKGEIK